VSRARTGLGTGVVLPILVSDATSFAVAGLTPRQFCAFVRKHRIPFAKDRRRTLVRVDRLLEAIDRLSGEGPSRPRAALTEDQVVAMAARPRARKGEA
jgi:hypothetical protein